MKKELGCLKTHRAYLGRPAKKYSIEPFPCSERKVFQLQVKGLVKRLKSIGCRDTVIGVSGGLDSTLAVLVTFAAYEKLGFDTKGIHLYTMPGFGTSKRTKTNAGILCKDLNLKLETIDITKSCKVHFRDIGHDGKTCDVTYENVQARMRTMILMNKANMTGGIVLGTGDLSEIALGWSTYNGDHMSMFAVNSGVPKTVVEKVCRWWAVGNAERFPLAAKAVNDIADTPVSPELIKNQVTEDKIGPYILHDFFLWNFIINEMGSKDLLINAKKYFKGRYEEGVIKSTLDVFMRRFFTQAFKRNCQPDGIKVFPFELSLHGWWIPSDLGIVKL